MEKRTWIIILIVAILTVLISIFLVLNKAPNKSPAESVCNTLSHNSESAINMVFFSDKEQAKKYSDFLLSFSPFKENEKSFNFYYITSEPDCELYQNIALLCYSKEIIKRASSCPSDLIVAIQSKPSNIRSSSYMNVISINSALPLTVFPHELGHALANLADEYTPANIPSGSKNCRESCSSFEKKDGCYQGCSRIDYSRSIENGIMRTLNSNKYGTLDESIILASLSKNAKITGKIIQETQDCEKSGYYLIQGKLENNNIEITGQSMESGCSGKNGNGGFSYSLILEDNSSYSGNFNPELIFTDSQENESVITGETFSSDREFLLRIPVIENSKYLEILDSKNKKLAEINLRNIGNRPCRIN